MGEAVGLEALHAPAFVIHTDQRIGPQFFDLAAQFGQLLAVAPIATKQNHAAHQWVAQALFVGLGQGGTGNVDDEGRVWDHAQSVPQRIAL